MENSKKQLKIISLFILIFAALSVARTVIGIFTITVTPDQIPEGLTEGLVRIALIIGQIGAIIFVIPQLYIGLKGVKLANGGEGSKAQIVWAIVLTVLSVVTLISTVSNILSTKDVLNNVLTLVIALCDVALYYLYAKYAKQIRNAA